MHGRAGQGLSIVVDVVVTQGSGVGNAGEGLGPIARGGAAVFFGLSIKV
jgi:hypothetical protein